MRFFQQLTLHQTWQQVLQLWRRPKFLYGLTLIAILVFAAYLRFTALDWDHGYLYHPDERNIDAAVSRLDWPKQNNPEFYAYNGFPIFLFEITSEIIAHFTHDPTWLTDWAKLNLLSRSYSAAFSLLSVWLFYKISRRVLKQASSVFVMLLAATTVSFLQYAHYGVTESLLVLEILALTFCSVRFIQEKKFRDLLWLAIFFGLSIGTKTSALAFIVIPALSVLLVYGKRWQTFILPLPLLILSFVIFYAVSPNTLQHLDKFRESMRYEGGVVRGDFIVPYTMQFLHTLPYLFQLKNLLWQTSPFVLLLALAGLFVFFKHRHQYRALWPMLLYSSLYFLYVGSWHAKFIRYIIPAIPALLFLAGIVIDQIRSMRLRRIVFMIVYLTSIFWACAYLQVFQQPQTRIMASEWIYQNIPNQSILLNEHWDDGLPSMEKPDIRYQHLELKLYDTDTSSKIADLATTLEKGDYLILSSRRLFGSIPRNEKYPYSKHYYQLLFAEKLGYKKIQQFASYPNFFGISIPDNQAEETFQVYDHPVVQIFQNVEHLSQAELYRRITDQVTP